MSGGPKGKVQEKNDATTTFYSLMASKTENFTLVFAQKKRMQTNEGEKRRNTF